ncbi:hypothetical protein IWQ60_000253 [Tieghemiomyces parasiticus]|uniref:Uncharacterized protein n=1 Tax=Tieghemiomyces parasiticus TaxID=78921 RepID=A0A9W8E2X4_9FUNG|nr:hypothetical protein IWQ60_000253 [Tieghemiomyces parasiticus]
MKTAVVLYTLAVSALALPAPPDSQTGGVHVASGLTSPFNSDWPIDQFVDEPEELNPNGYDPYPSRKTPKSRYFTASESLSEGWGSGESFEGFDQAEDVNFPSPERSSSIVGIATISQHETDPTAESRNQALAASPHFLVSELAPCLRALAQTYFTLAEAAITTVPDNVSQMSQANMYYSRQERPQTTGGDTYALFDYPIPAEYRKAVGDQDLVVLATEYAENKPDDSVLIGVLEALFNGAESGTLLEDLLAFLPEQTQKDYRSYVPDAAGETATRFGLKFIVSTVVPAITIAMCQINRCGKAAELWDRFLETSSDPSEDNGSADRVSTPSEFKSSILTTIIYISSFFSEEGSNDVISTRDASRANELEQLLTTYDSQLASKDRMTLSRVLKTPIDNRLIYGSLFLNIDEYLFEPSEKGLNLALSKRFSPQSTAAAKKKFNWF